MHFRDRGQGLAVWAAHHWGSGHGTTFQWSSLAGASWHTWYTAILEAVTNIYISVDIIPVMDGMNIS